MKIKFESEVNYQINERVQGKTDFFRQTFITIDFYWRSGINFMILK